jgi:hypothetical protein
VCICKYSKNPRLHKATKCDLKLENYKNSRSVKSTNCTTQKSTILSKPSKDHIEQQNSWGKMPLKLSPTWKEELQSN